MAFQSMTDMAKTPEEIKEDIADMMPSPSNLAASGPKYSYGLCISFDEDTLEKLGLDDGEMPSVGDMIHLIAMAKVTSVSENERESTGGNTKMCKRVELQITHLAVESESDEDVREQMSESRRNRFYDDGEE